VYLKQLAQQFAIVQINGVLFSIVLDRDPQFTSKFW
jgi:hypothetical protein